MFFLGGLGGFLRCLTDKAVRAARYNRHTSLDSTVSIMWSVRVATYGANTADRTACAGFGMFAFRALALAPRVLARKTRSG